MPTALLHSLLGLLLALASLETVWADALPSAYELATEHYRARRWAEAEAAFQQSLDGQYDLQRSDAILFYLAECQMQQGLYGRAREHYLHLWHSSDSEFSKRARFRSGEAAILSGDVKTGRIELSDFVRRHPQETSVPYALCLLGDYAHRHGDYQLAANYYRAIVKDFPSSPRLPAARLGLAKALLADGQTLQASNVLEKSAQFDDPRQAASAATLLGRAKFEAGEFSEALEFFRQAYLKLPRSAQAYRARIGAAWALWRLQQFQQMESEVAPLKADPQWEADYRYLVGMAAYGDEQWTAGRKQLAQAAALRPDHPSHDAILFYQGLCCLRDKRTAAAQNLLQRLQVDYPDSVWCDDALWELSQLARSRDETTNHEALTSRLRNNHPQSGYLSSFYGNQPDDSQDSESFVRARELFDKAVGLERDGHYHSACVAYRQLNDSTAISSIKLECLVRSARLHRRLKRGREAYRFFDQVLREYPTSEYAAEACAAVGWLQASAGNTSQAKEDLHDLLEKFPQSSQIAGAAYWLARQSADEEDSETAQHYLAIALEGLHENGSELEQQQRMASQVSALRCQLAASAQRWVEVEEIATASISKTSQHAEQLRIAFWQAEAAFREKKYAAARDRFDRLDRRTIGIHEPWVAMVPLRRAQLAARRQQWTEVLKLTERIDRDHSDFALFYEVDYLRGRALAGRGEMDAARQSYREVLENQAAEDTETSVAAQWMIGETLFHQRNYELARLAYQAVLDREAPADWYARAALQAGKCWELQDHWDEARSLYRLALKSWPDAEHEPQIEARLKWAESRTNQRR